MMILHNKNHRIFDDAEGFGSTYHSFSTNDWGPGETKSVIYHTIALSLDIIKKEEDVTDNYCQDLPSDQVFDLDHCIGKFFARSIGCLSPWETYYSPTYPWCQNGSQLEGLCFQLYFNHPLFALLYFPEYLKIKQNVTDDGGEKHIYELTGCKSGCNMKRYRATLKERVRYQNVSTVSDDQVFLRDIEG